MEVVPIFMAPPWPQSSKSHQTQEGEASAPSTLSSCHWSSCSSTPSLGARPTSVVRRQSTDPSFSRARGQLPPLLYRVYHKHIYRQNFTVIPIMALLFLSKRESWTAPRCSTSLSHALFHQHCTPLDRAPPWLDIIVSLALHPIKSMQESKKFTTEVSYIVVNQQKVQISQCLRRLGK